ncbi:MAG: NUDIX domain-containing protein [Patescibacteria group bacterium]|nr:NUDIX domain-containing protein [Patescibacteria group bacterium]
MKNVLNIVNENDEIIGQETREKIHKSGLLHREIHIYFITPNKEIIFQHRAKDKDTFPNLLDATVGGHVEIGDSYEQTAIKETEEETGIKIKANDLIFISKVKIYSEDKMSKTINNVFRFQYAYVYRGNVQDLKIEPEEISGFEVWPLDKLARLTDDEKKKFIPRVLRFVTTELRNFIENLRINYES